MTNIHFFQKNIMSAFFSFAVLYFIIQVLSFVGLNTVGIRGFTATPYATMISLLFTLLYFFIYFFNISIFLNAKIYLREEIGIVFLWLMFSVVALFIGVINSNPAIYIITDFVYAHC